MIEALTGQGIDVRRACRTLGVSESGFYAWKTRPASPRALRRIWLAGEIVDVHKASGGTYGARASPPSCATAARSLPATTRSR